MKSIAIILSGGRGTRLGAALPKQYIELRGKPILAYTLEAFQDSCVDEILLVAAEDYIPLCRKIAAGCGCTKVRDIIVSGQERYDSVRQGLEYLAEQEECVVLIHDGARPFIRPDIIARILEETCQCGAAIAATPCTDTIKLIDDSGNIISTTQRRLTWAAQTPQAFFLKEITAAYRTVFGRTDEDVSNPGTPEEGRPDFGTASISDIRRSVTDDAMVYQMVYPKRPVHVVDAGSGNFKITTAQDLVRAEAFLTHL